MFQLKQRIYHFIDDQNPAGLKWNDRFNSIIMLLIVLSIIAIILESHEAFATKYNRIFYAFEAFAIAIFTIEYILRVWVAKFKYKELSVSKATIKFIFTPMAIIDLLAILPFYMEMMHAILAAWGIVIFDLRFLRTLRLMRLLRILKLSRYSKSLQLVSHVLKEKKEELMITIFMCIILLVLSSALMYNIETKAQPEAFPDIFSTFWWAVATLTTVGYGDVYPITGWGKFVSGIIALLGIGMIALPTGILSSAFIEKISHRKVQHEAKCPRCGHVFDTHTAHSDH